MGQQESDNWFSGAGGFGGALAAGVTFFSASRFLVPFPFVWDLDDEIATLGGTEDVQLTERAINHVDAVKVEFYQVVDVQL